MSTVNVVKSEPTKYGRQDTTSTTTNAPTHFYIVADRYSRRERIIYLLEIDKSHCLVIDRLILALYNITILYITTY